METAQNDKTKARKLIERWGKLQDKRTPWEPLWEDAATYIHPRREGLFEDSTRSKRKGQNRYSDHAIKANQIHADGMQGNLISPAAQWFKLKYRDNRISDIPLAKDWLEAGEKEVYGVCRGTNYYSAMGEFLLDAGSICTAVIYTEWDYANKTMVFMPVSPAEIWIAEDRHGKVSTVYRKRNMTVEQIRDSFDTLPDKVKRDIEEGELDVSYEILHCVTRRRSPNKEGKTNKDMPWASFYVFLEDEFMLRESGFKENPYIVLRYRKTGDETYGSGPGMDALMTILRLNQFEKGQLQLAQLLVDPPLQIPPNFKGRVKYTPRARNYLASREGEIKRMDVHGDYGVGEHAIQELKAAVDEFYNVTYFNMLNRQERQMTAREVIERQAEKAAIIGSSVGRLYQEALNPMIKRIFNCLLRNGVIPPPPPGVMEAGAKLDVELIGPLAMAQKYYASAQGIAKGIEAISPLVQYDPTILDWFDFDYLAKETGESSGMPQRGIREDRDVQMIRANRAKMQQQQAAMAQAQQVADMVPKLNQKVQPQSPLEDLNEQLAASATGGMGGAT